MRDEEQRRFDREAARARRRARRKERREAKQNAQNARAATAATGGVVAENVAYLPPTSAMLDAHIRRVERYLDLIEFDPTVGTEAKLRLFIAALPALTKGIEAVEFRERLEALEARARFAVGFVNWSRLDRLEARFPSGGLRDRFAAETNCMPNRSKVAEAPAARASRSVAAFEERRRGRREQADRRARIGAHIAYGVAGRSAPDRRGIRRGACRSRACLARVPAVQGRAADTRGRAVRSAAPPGLITPTETVVPTFVVEMAGEWRAAFQAYRERNSP